MNFVEFMNTNGYYILYIVLSVVMFTIMIIKAVKDAKLNKVKDAIAENNVGLLDLFAKIEPLVIKAEQMYGRGNGAFKLEYVLTQLMLEAMKKNVKVDEQALVDKINEVVKTTKQVNAYEPKPEQEVQVTQN